MGNLDYTQVLNKIENTRRFGPFLFLCYNYINSLDIIYYQVYAWPKTPTLTFTMNEISNSIASYKLIHGIAILYTMISLIILLYLLKSQNNNND